MKVNLVIGFFLTLLIVGGIVFALAPAKNQGFTPVQPIPFSHKLHAGDRQIQCAYCHTSTEKSRHASVPSEAVCMNCHKLVKTDSPHIKYLADHYNSGQPIPWVRVHNLPEFTYFNHRRHIAQDIKCQVCHGEVQNMEQVKQNAPLTMGWCVNCHRQPQYNAPTNCDTCHR